VGEHGNIVEYVAAPQPTRLVNEAVGPFEANALDPLRCSTDHTSKEIENATHPHRDRHTQTLEVGADPQILAGSSESDKQEARSCGPNRIDDLLVLIR
jgi:hypothetical protein